MKQIVDDQSKDWLKQTSLQIELAIDIPTTNRVYTPNPHWDALENAHDPYWDTPEELTQSDDSCDILDQQCCSSGNFSQDNPGEAFVSAYNLGSAHQQSASLGEQIFIDPDRIPFSPHQYLSVRAQVKEDTQKFAPEQVQSVRLLSGKEVAPEHTHWIEKYWVERCNTKYYYFRYMWMEGRKKHRTHLGSVQSRIAQQKVEWVKEAIDQGMSPCEIKEWLIAKKISPLAGDMWSK